MANGLDCNYLRTAGKPYKGKNKPARKKIRQVSKKKREELKIYAKLRKEFLDKRPRCEVCFQEIATDVHHKAGRGRNTLAVETWLPVCRPCHDAIHANPKWAEANGYLDPARNKR
jgi:hypothetical protein